MKRIQARNNNMDTMASNAKPVADRNRNVAAQPISNKQVAAERLLDIFAQAPVINAKVRKWLFKVEVSKIPKGLHLSEALIDSVMSKQPDFSKSLKKDPAAEHKQKLANDPHFLALKNHFARLSAIVKHKRKSKPSGR